MTSMRVSSQERAWGKGDFLVVRVRLSSEAGALLPACDSPKSPGYISARLQTAGMEDRFSLASQTTSHEPNLPPWPEQRCSIAPMAAPLSIGDPRRTAVDLQDAHRSLPLVRFFRLCGN
jgi:hypothetical protein